MPSLTLPDVGSIRYRLTRPESSGTPARAPLALVHGAGAGLYVWLEQRRSLSPTRRVLSFDLPGHGLSRPALPQISIPAYARVAAELARALRLPPAVWVGHSMGGAVAQWLALEHPDRVAGLILIATGATLAPHDLVVQTLETDPDGFGALIAEIGYARATAPDLIRRYTAGPTQVSAEVTRADFEACRRFDARPRLAEIRVPTLIITGEEDILAPPAASETLAAGIADATIVVFPDAGHMILQEQPDRLTAEIEAFLDRCRL